MLKLKKYEKVYLDDGFHIIKKGRVLVKDILPNGKIITNENLFTEGDIIGNFFELLEFDENELMVDMGVEIEPLEDTIVEKFPVSKKDLDDNPLLKKVIFQLLKKVGVKLTHQLYNKKGYLLFVLKLLANDKGVIIKKDVKYENFNISKSQFYNLFTLLKNENFFKEVNNTFVLNLKKVDEYFEEELDTV